MPALVTDRGILTETPAMLVYVAQSLPAAGLAPIDDPFAFAEVQAFNSYLCSQPARRITPIACAAIAGSMPTTRHSIAAMQRKVPESVGACFDLIERDMLKGPWVMGERYTICDPYLFTLAQWLEADGVDPKRIPRVIDHRRRMSERAAVRKAIAEELA